jgi:hypothetical protein
VSTQFWSLKSFSFFI